MRPSPDFSLSGRDFAGISYDEPWQAMVAYDHALAAAGIEMNYAIGGEIPGGSSLIFVPMRDGRFAVDHRLPDQEQARTWIYRDWHGATSAYRSLLDEEVRQALDRHAAACRYQWTHPMDGL